jgi:hypothetical protein
MRLLTGVLVVLVLATVAYAPTRNAPTVSTTNIPNVVVSTAPQVEERNPTKNQTALPRGGVVVVVDPQTRQVREATPEEIGALGSAARSGIQATQSQPVAVQGAGGAAGVILGPEFENYAVAVRSPDGSLRVEEVTGNKAAARRVFDSMESSKSSNAK